jgi:hypothetical protein
MNPEIRDRMRFLQRFRNFTRDEMQLNMKICGGSGGKRKG